MCTVTILAHPRGVRLISNRDEQRTRPAALLPRVYDLGGRRVLFPVDPQGGGTWVGVNDAGVAAALLNMQGTRASHHEQPKQSRGVVVRQLLHRPSLAEAAAAVTSLDRLAFDPFQVVIVHGDHVAVVTSDEAGMRATELRLDRPMLFTSSSLGQRRVEPPRRRLFERLVLGSPSGWLEGQELFHDHQWRRRPEISVRMERRDALTVSRTTVDITNGARHLIYEVPLGAAPRDRVRECYSLP